MRERGGEGQGAEPRRHAVTRSPASPTGPHRPEGGSSPAKAPSHHPPQIQPVPPTLNGRPQQPYASPTPVLSPPHESKDLCQRLPSMQHPTRRSACWSEAGRSVASPSLVGGGEPKLFLGKSAVTVGLLLGVRYHWPVSLAAPPMRAAEGWRIDVSGGFVSPGPGGGGVVGRRAVRGHDAPLPGICFYLWIRCCGQVEGPELS